MRMASLLLVLGPLVILTSVPGFAASELGNLGNIADFSQAGDTFTIKTSSQVVVQIQILQSNLFRIWAGPNDSLVGEGSFSAPIVLSQTYLPVNAQLQTEGKTRIITTGDFALVVNHSPLMFELYRPDRTTLIWRELRPLHLSETGSYQTLSSIPEERFFGGGQQNGSFEFKGRIMEVSYGDGWEEGDRPNPAPFYMSSLGYGVLRNTWADGRYDFWSTDYLTTMHRENRFDAYYMVGQSIHEVLDLYTQLTGRAGLLPRWAFEYGDADCYNDRDNADKPGTVPDGWSDGPTGTTPDVVASVAAKYREHDMPGGWILPNDGYGCGYTDLPSVVESLHTYGFRTGLWTESGVDKIAWEVGQAGTRVQKLDVAWTGKGYQFALDANKEAAQGILNNSNSRPFVWTVMGWAGIQRYAVTWTGDQSGSWDYIRWHIPTLIGSGLSGMVYSTGDVDGIYGGSPETFTRDLQWKCFTPVLMGMSGWSKAERKHPWWFDEPYRSINRTYLKLKMRLMPYMYTLAHEAEQNGAPIVRGIFWDHPNDPHAYDKVTRNQFFLGRDLLIAPVYRSQAASGGWRDSIYLPAGKWVDFWNGTLVQAETEGLFIDYPVTLDKIPVFVRAGAILPQYPEALFDGQVETNVLTLEVFPEGESEYTLYEDDGNTRAYQNGEYSLQRFHVEANSAASPVMTIELEPATGKFAGMHEKRLFVIKVHSPNAPDEVTIGGRPIALLPQSEFEAATKGWYYAADDQNGVMHIKTDTISVRAAHTIAATFYKTLPVATIDRYPRRPGNNGYVSADKILVINRPAEEAGYPLENAFDGNPATWFRTVRDQAVSYGPHEFALALGERKVIDGFQIAPRNDKWWKYGQVSEYELYVSEQNGDWGNPVITDTLRLTDSIQTVRFTPTAGRVVRFRALSTYNPDADSTAVPSDTGGFNALVPIEVKPVTISEFRLLEHQLPSAASKTEFLSDHEWLLAEGATGQAIRHSTLSENSKSGIWLNGLRFDRGLTVHGRSRIDYHLQGDWQLLRVESGIIEANSDSPVGFQIYGNEKLLFDSGPITGQEIAKIDVDIRGITLLSLRTETTSDKTQSCWANPMVIGFEGDQVGK